MLLLNLFTDKLGLTMRFLLLLVLSVIVVGGMADDMDDFERMMQEPRDRSNWIDPHDMGMLDSRPGSGTCQAVEEKQKQCERDLAKCKNNLKIPKEMTEENCSKLQDLNEKTPVEPDVFLRRFTRHLVNKLQLNPDEDAHLKVEIVLDKFKILTLLNFLSPQSNTNQVDVDEILTSFIKGVDSYETSPFVDFLKVGYSIHELTSKVFIAAPVNRAAETPAGSADVPLYSLRGSAGQVETATIPDHPTGRVGLHHLALVPHVRGGLGQKDVGPDEEPAA